MLSFFGFNSTFWTSFFCFFAPILVPFFAAVLDQLIYRTVFTLFCSRGCSLCCNAGPVFAAVASAATFVEILLQFLSSFYVVYSDAAIFT
ncbi:hypothetical protein R3W88_000705 [Solanum pinnatisectum]|uniref:Uncharacterized protein n=1 Tax=Solanum pinnatisectum TaxID=50273 RepID=A0AAV9MHU9_9SOLN|nr:hypothetical protein R3W88_000705 [Solanum pinnatisectum]